MADVDLIAHADVPVGDMHGFVMIYAWNDDAARMKLDVS